MLGKIELTGDIKDFVLEVIGTTEPGTYSNSCFGTSIPAIRTELTITEDGSLFESIASNN